MDKKSAHLPKKHGINVGFTECHMSGVENVKVTSFDISPKFTLFCGHKGAKPGVKTGKKVPISLKNTV